MRGMGPIGLVLFLVPALLYGVFQFYIMMQVNEVISDNLNFDGGDSRLEEAVAAETGAVTFEIVSTSGRVIDLADAAALLAPATLSRKRWAKVSSVVLPEALLKPGETLPEGEMLALMVEARAAAVADRVCARFLAQVAASCGITSYTVTPIRTDHTSGFDLSGFEGWWEVETSVVFTPQAPVGDFPASATVVYTEKDFDLEYGAVALPVQAEFDAGLDRLLAAAARACDELKAIQGNCVLTGVRFNLGHYGSGNLRQNFDVAYFAPLRTAAALAE